MKKMRLCFDPQVQRATARRFLTELAERRLPLTVASVSTAEEIAETQRAAVMVEWFRAVDVAIVLVGPQTATSRPVATELEMAARAGCPVLGILVDGASVGVALPKGLNRDRVHGWDWGQLGRALR